MDCGGTRRRLDPNRQQPSKHPEGAYQAPSGCQWPPSPAYGSSIERSCVNFNAVSPRNGTETENHVE